jgi:hypothetical protein
MSRTRVFADMLDDLGIWWPRGEGDALRAAADGWQQAAGVIDEITTILDTIASTIVANYEGGAAQKFAEHWAKWSGPNGHLAMVAADSRRLAGALSDFGGDIDAADASLAALIEQALGAPRSEPINVDSDEWIAWLRQCGVLIRDDMNGRAVTRTAVLDEVTDRHFPPAPNTPDLGALIPSRVTWPDPGLPDDLSGVAKEPVDFGAGEGRLPAGLDPDTGVFEPLPDPTQPAVPLPGTLTPAGPVTVTINGNNNTVTIGTNGLPLPAGPPDEVPPIEEPVVELPPVEEPPIEAPLSGFGGGGGFDPDALSSGGSFDPSAFDVPEFTPLTEIPRPETPDTDVSEQEQPWSPYAAAGLTGITGAAAAANKLASGGNKSPMLPFLPMGGAMAGGDESPEPRRKKRK